jgi:hypothetical protein
MAARLTTVESKMNHEMESAVPPVESAIGEVYVLAISRSYYVEKLFDSKSIEDKIQNAIAARSIGEFTDKRFIAFLNEFEKSCTGWIRKYGGYIVTFILRRSIRDNSVSYYQLQALLGKEIPLTSYGHQDSLQEIAFITAVDLANKISGSGAVIPAATSPVESATSDAFAELGDDLLSMLGNTTLSRAERLKAVTARLSGRTAAESIESVFADSLPTTRAASGVGVPKTAVEAAYDESIEWAEEPADVRDKEVLAAVKETNELLKERLPLPKESATLPTAPDADVAATEPAVEKKTRRKKRTKAEYQADVNNAVKYYYNNEWDGITQGDVEKRFQLKQGALSTGYGKAQMQTYRPKPCQKTPVSKAVSDDWIHNEKR